jgi:hypothetical protein
MPRFGLLLSVALSASLAAHASAGPTTPATPAAPVVPVPLTIVIYDQDNFKGRSIKLAAATPNLAAHQFEDKVASFEVQGAGDWVLCVDRNYKGNCVRVQAKAGDLRILQLYGRVSSLYPVPAPTPPAAPATPAAQR